MRPAVRRRGYDSRHRCQDSPQVRRQLQVNQRGPDIPPIPVSIPLGVIGYFPMVFSRRLPRLEIPNGADRLRVPVNGLYEVFPDLNGYFMAFLQYFLFTLPVPKSVTSPLHLQPWDPRSSSTWATIPAPQWYTFSPPLTTHTPVTSTVASTMGWRNAWCCTGS